ncbi:MAG: ATP-dependent DNA helicase RecG [Pirellulaceae bacterium]|nr:ATP-dependent DNA helicase RecG [Pirellulaceae bacterium]
MPTESAQQSQLLFGPVARVPGVGAERARLLAKLGVRRGIDLLFLFPRSFQEPAPLARASEFVEGGRVSFLGTVLDIGQRVTQSGKHLLGVQVAVEGGGNVRLVWFNQAFRAEMYRPGDQLLVTGVLKSTVLNWEMVQPQTRPAADQPPASNHPLPIYPLTEGLKQSAMHQMLRQAVPVLVEQIEEALPEIIQQRLNVPGIRQAINDVHFPASLAAAQAALRRFKLQELLVLQLALAMQRSQREQATRAPQCEPSGKLHARILNRLGHSLTADQSSAVEDIRQDMARAIPMNRLLQGDVGCGKTLVAQYAMLLCVANGHQAALMAPTEVLARQHAETLQRNLARSRVQVGLLHGGLPRGQRTKLLEQISAGQVNLIVGTQALLSEQVHFQRLGLVIVDEQHKFGVLQRARLRSEQLQPHYLILSATPIPRTIAMTAFGDLDVSIIRTRPPGQATVRTYLTTHEQLSSWWQFVDRQISRGRQAYVIAPRIATAAVPEPPVQETISAFVDEVQPSAINASSELEQPDSAIKQQQMPTTSLPSVREGAASAKGTFELLRAGPLAHRRLGLLHGRLPPHEKEAVLDQFARGQLDVLVATTVVEVGIDVPNASVITILDADRLGLSQLHQLRGRVARGRFTGYACAVASVGCQSQDNERLAAFQKTDNGFELAELDLKLRGPGDLLGTSQTGMPSLRVANLVEDTELLDLARETAREILKSDPQLAQPEFTRLIHQTLRRYGKSLELGDVG